MLFEIHEDEAERGAWESELPVKTRALLALAWHRVISDWLLLDHLTKRAMTPH